MVSSYPNFLIELKRSKHRFWNLECFSFGLLILSHLRTVSPTLKFWLQALFLSNYFLTICWRATKFLLNCSLSSSTIRRVSILSYWMRVVLLRNGKDLRMGDIFWLAKRILLCAPEIKGNYLVLPWGLPYHPIESYVNHYASYGVSLLLSS